MSARDKLDTYERDWARHLNWRKPRDGGEPGLYLDERSGLGGLSIRFREMPSDLRDRVAKRLESYILGLVDLEHTALIEELRAAAVTEAKATLKELGESDRAKAHRVAVAVQDGLGKAFDHSTAKVFFGEREIVQSDASVEREG